MTRRQIAHSLTGFCLLSATAVFLLAQGPGDQQEKAPSKDKKGASPHTKIWREIDGKTISVVYGRPYKKGRTIFGETEPFNKVWRFGANECTLFTTTGDVMLGSVHVTKGAYCLFAQFNEKNEWTLIVSKNTTQWGAFTYKQTDDLGRTPMKAEKVKSPTEQLTMTLPSTGAHSAQLRMAWDDVVTTVDIMMH